MKKIYNEEPKILVCMMNSEDVVTASKGYGDDNVGSWLGNWFVNGGGNNG